MESEHSIVTGNPPLALKDLLKQRLKTLTPIVSTVSRTRAESDVATGASVADGATLYKFIGALVDCKVLGSK